MTQQILTPGPLLDGDGHLAQAGYATYLAKTYRRDAITAGKLRIKEWDYYLITNERYGVALTLADNSYMGLIGASFLWFDEGRFVNSSAMKGFTLGKIGMPPSSAQGSVSTYFNNASCRFSTANGKRNLFLRMDNFADGEAFEAELTLSDAPQDSMVIATPFPGKPRAFYYNQKIVGMTAQGNVTIGQTSYAFHGADTLGMLDWGRGVWTYDNTWYWSAAHGYIGGEKFGFNLGYGFGDTSAASENMLFYKGVAHKLGLVNFGIPVAPDGQDDFLKTWRFTSPDQRFEAEFTPIMDRSGAAGAGPVLSDPHQVFGRFNGVAVLDDGTRLEMKDFLGFAEKVHNKW